MTSHTAETLEQRARRLEHEYQAVLDAAVDAVVIISASGLIELANHASERLFGYSEAELLGRNVRILMPEPYHSEHDGYIERYLRTRQGHIIGVGGREVRARRRDGSLLDVELAVGVVSGSEPQRFVGFIRDISVRKRAQEALARSESELQSAQELANFGNYVIHTSGQEQDYRSPQYWRLLGRDPTDVKLTLEGYLANVVHPSDRPRVAAAAASLDSAPSFDLIYRIVRPDGEVRHVHHIARAVRDEQGCILRQEGTLHDITERQQAEDEARNMQDRLTHFGRISTMGEMAAGIAHEINQPLTAIATYSQACQRLLTTEAAAPADEDILQGLKQIETQALRAGEVIRRLRSFVKNREVRREIVDPNQLLEDSMILAHTDTRHHSITIRLEKGEGLPLVQADPVQVQQVILNLVRNGIDAMLDLPYERREIVLRTARDAQGDVEFMVCDRGPGLSEQAEVELFNPFFTTKQGGTGLGLAISHSIVRAHGGKVWYRPYPAGGACFFFTLPAAPVKTGA